MARWSFPGRVASALALVSACGGQSMQRSDGSTGGDSGDDGNGGTTTTGGAPTTGGVAGTIDVGGTGPVTGGTGGGQACDYAGHVYSSGESFPNGDGCNTCYCENGSVSCTLIDCRPSDECDRMSAEYAAALAAAKVCEPSTGLSDCVSVVASSLQCGCPTMVNRRADQSLLDYQRLRWSGLGCGAGIVCGACPEPPTTGYCSADGVCVDAYAE